MIIQTLSDLYVRDLYKLKEEISLYNDEENIWKTPHGINNSAGNLCLHLIGNLNHFVGLGIINNGYVRKRDEEFNSKNIDRKILTAEIDKVIEVIIDAFLKLDIKQFEETFPLPKSSGKVSTEHMILHLLTHLNYHIGQINYHRRLIEFA